MNKKIVGLAALILAGFASCQFMKPKSIEEIPAAPVIKALPQDPSLQVYFNQSQTSSYSW